MTEETYPFQEILSSLKAREQKPDSKGTLVVVLVVVVISLISVGVLMFRSFRNAKKLAKALHERDVLREQLKQIETDNTIQNSEAVVRSLQQSIEQVETEAVVLQERRDSLTRALQDATTWEALDQITR